MVNLPVPETKLIHPNCGDVILKTENDFSKRKGSRKL